MFSPDAPMEFRSALLILGVWSSGRLEKLYGKDPSAAVIDEVLGVAVTLAHAPITPWTLVLGFGRLGHDA